MNEPNLYEFIEELMLEKNHLIERIKILEKKLEHAYHMLIVSKQRIKKDASKS